MIQREREKGAKKRRQRERERKKRVGIGGIKNRGGRTPPPPTAAPQIEGHGDKKLCGNQRSGVSPQLPKREIVKGEKRRGGRGGTPSKKEWWD